MAKVELANWRKRLEGRDGSRARNWGQLRFALMGFGGHNCRVRLKERKRKRREEKREFGRKTKKA